MRNEFADMPGPKYRVRIEVYVTDEPETVVVKEDAPADRPDDVERAAAIVAGRFTAATINYEADNQ